MDGFVMLGEETAEMDGEAQSARERESVVIQSYYEEAEKAPAGRRQHATGARQAFRR